ncbi:hypothetical protein CGL56_12605 [Neolewinella marina]|uniref:Secretion system C-terminal sorting domain-containing protein n=2 Tax=Neolewinella marina TaxID=438751 RepID=A0A2G0CDJ5_9BACT|nr:hypothetical protein CGL56_12605 [Neolewinella marina]
MAGALFLPFLISAQGGACQTVTNNVGSEEIILAAEAGTPEAQLPVYPLTGNEVTSFSGVLQSSDPTTKNFRADNSAGPETPETCAAMNTNVKYDLYTFQPAQSGAVTLSKTNLSNPPSIPQNTYTFSIFRGTSITQAICDNWVASSGTTTGANRPTITFEVTGGQKYFIFVAIPNSSIASGGLSYTLTVDPAGPVLYQGTPLATNHAYTYLATTAATDDIVAQSPTADFRTLNAGDYEVYGVDYETTTVDPTTFPGSTLSGIQTGNCLQLSQNSLFLVVSDAAAPVDWLDFRAVARVTGVELQWEVASETENDYFRVERSVDGTEWEALDEVAGNGTSNRYAAFSYLDATPAAGTNFYRLAQVDFDGTVDYSAVVTALWEAPESELLTFPNPFTSRLTVRTSADLPGQPRMFDLQGREVSQQLRITVEGRQAVVEADSLPIGVYLIQWGSEQQRVVKN